MTFQFEFLAIAAMASCQIHLDTMSEDITVGNTTVGRATSVHD